MSAKSRIANIFLNNANIFLKDFRIDYFCSMKNERDLKHEDRVVEWNTVEQIAMLFLYETEGKFHTSEPSYKNRAVLKTELARHISGESSKFSASWLKRIVERFGGGRYVVEITARAGVVLDPQDAGEEAVEGECRCIRYVSENGGGKWYANGCETHPNGG